MFIRTLRGDGDALEIPDRSRYVLQRLFRLLYVAADDWDRYMHCTGDFKKFAVMTNCYLA